MAQIQTVSIKMLLNAWDMEVGKTYQVEVDRANQLTGMGYAVLVEGPADAEEAD